jgi:hypothetical protein
MLLSIYVLIFYGQTFFLVAYLRIHDIVHVHIIMKQGVESIFRSSQVPFHNFK